MKTKKIIIILISILFFISIFTGCRNDEIKNNNDKINVVTTIFPQYDFVREIAEDNVNLTMLISPGEEVHSFEPTPQDIIKIEECDIFIYTGGESDTWVKEILESINIKDKKIISIMDSIKPVEEEIKEGMTKTDAEHNHGEDETEYDEHPWTSPVNTKKIVKDISAALIEADKKNNSIYQKNTNNYILKLEKLDNDFKTIVKNAQRKELIFGDRFPFIYFTKEYGLDYYAAFPGCSSETEASASTITFLINKVKKDNIPVVLKIELSTAKIADTISEDTQTKVLQMHSIQNISKDEFDEGATYLSLMEQNLISLKEALN